jgi:hypothetical protein
VQQQLDIWVKRQTWQSRVSDVSLLLPAVLGSHVDATFQLTGTTQLDHILLYYYYYYYYYYYNYYYYNYYYYNYYYYII